MPIFEGSNAAAPSGPPVAAPSNEDVYTPETSPEVIVANTISYLTSLLRSLDNEILIQDAIDELVETLAQQRLKN